MITVGRDGTVQSRKQICTPWQKGVLLPWLAEVISCHLLHWSITDREQAHTLLEGAAGVSPREETLVFVLPGHSLHPSPLVFLFPCSTPPILSYLLLWGLSIWKLPCFHILGLSFASASHLGTHFICLMPLVVISLPELLPSLFPSLFQQLLSLCVVLFPFFYY